MVKLTKKEGAREASSGIFFCRGGVHPYFTCRIIARVFSVQPFSWKPLLLAEEEEEEESFNIEDRHHSVRRKPYDIKQASSLLLSPEANNNSYTTHCCCGEQGRGLNGVLPRTDMIHIYTRRSEVKRSGRRLWVGRKAQ